MYKPYTLRQESFGYTFFDKRKLKHKFLSVNELEIFFFKNQIVPKDIEYLIIKEKNYRKDIIYSPIRIYFELTLACNLKCRYCFNNSGHPRKCELNTEEVFRVLDDLKKCNVLDLRFTGGEPTYRKDWFDILQYAKQLGFAVSCNTNAVFINSKIPKLFTQLNIEQVTVSIDGNKQHHEYNRGKGTFEKTISNLKAMHDLGVHLRINTLVNNYSVNDVEFMLALASQFVEEINFFTIVFIGRGFRSEKTDGVTVYDHLKMSQKIKALKSKYPNLRILHFAEVSRNTSVSEENEKKFGLKIGPPSGTTTFNISSHGYYSCGAYSPCIDNNLFLGNAKKLSIFDVWQNNQKLEKIRNDSRKLILFCKKCKKFKKGECQGSKYETELHRLINPGINNSTCIFGNGPSLLKLC